MRVFVFGFVFACVLIFMYWLGLHTADCERKGLSFLWEDLGKPALTDAPFDPAVKA